MRRREGRRHRRLEGYRAAVDRHLGHATHVLDRFHVIGWFAAGLTAVRRDVQRRQPAGVTPVFDPEVFEASRKRGFWVCWCRLGASCHEECAGGEVVGVGQAVGGAA